jgi:glycosyltransferase involved in cell wall biosynthesis
MNKRPLFIVLIPGFPDDESDKNCLPFQQKFVKTFKEIHPELEVAVIAFQYPYKTAAYRWFGIPVFPFGGKNRGGIYRLLLRRRLFRQLEALRNEHKIIGLLSFWCGECAIVGKKFADRHQLKHYCWICGQDALKENKYPVRMKAAGGELIALSDFLQEEFAANHRVRPAHVIPPGIDRSDFARLQTTRDIDLLAAGSLIQLKQFEIFVETVAVLKRTRPSIRAILAGEGPEKDKLRDLVRLFGLENNLEIKGEVAHPELIMLMQRTKVFLHPSRYEGFGVVCIEALQAGAAVISFVKPMKEKTAHWFVAKNKADMADKTEGLLDNHLPLQITNPGFDIRETVEKLAALYA